MDTQFKEYESLIDLLDDLDKEGITGIRQQEIYKRFISMQARMHGIPYSGGFELTPLCNFDCKMCYVHLSKFQMEKNSNILSTEQWLDIMRQAVDAGMMHADITGGECLTHPGFKELYLYLLSRGVEVSVLTNGQLITEEMADFFARYRPSVIQITVYGSDDDAYENVTGKRAFRDVANAIELLKARGIRMLLSTTPSKFMQKDTRALLEYLRSTGVKYGIGTGSLPAREETGKKLEEYAPSNDLYIQLHKDDAEYNRANFEPVPAPSDLNIFRMPKGYRATSYIGCSSGQCTFHINWKGQMTPCIPFHIVSIDTLSNGFDASWKWIKEQIKSYRPPKECTECPKLSSCVTCVAEKTFGKLKGPLNKNVCTRLECYMKAGIIKSNFEPECV